MKNEARSSMDAWSYLRFNRDTISHFFRSLKFSRPPSRSASHGRRSPSASISKISSTSRPCAGTTCSKKGATFARPVWNPAMQNTRAEGSWERKCSMDCARLSCSPGIHRQSAARMRVYLCAFSTSKGVELEPQRCPCTLILGRIDSGTFFATFVRIVSRMGGAG